MTAAEQRRLRYDLILYAACHGASAGEIGIIVRSRPEEINAVIIYAGMANRAEVSELCTISRSHDADMFPEVAAWALDMGKNLGLFIDCTTSDGLPTFFPSPVDLPFDVTKALATQLEEAQYDKTRKRLF